MPWVHDHIRSTFPIPKREIRRRKWALALQNPRTWLAAIPAMIAGMAAAPPLVIAAAGAVGIAGVGAYWARRSKELEGEVVEQFVRDHNSEQDSELINLIRKLSRHGYQSYAATLGSFAGLKTKIERSLYQEDGNSGDREQIGKLVDDLVFHVVDQLEEMAKIEYRLRADGRPAPPPGRAEELNKSWDEMAGRVRRAHATLEETWHNLDVLLNPIPSGKQSGGRLEESIEQLREENRIAEDIRKRFLADAAARASLPPEEAAAEAAIEATFDRSQDQQEPA